MPVFHTKTIESILDPVAQQVNNKHIALNGLDWTDGTGKIWSTFRYAINSPTRA